MVWRTRSDQSLGTRDRPAEAAAGAEGPKGFVSMVLGIAVRPFQDPAPSQTRVIPSWGRLGKRPRCGSGAAETGHLCPRSSLGAARARPLSPTRPCLPVSVGDGGRVPHHASHLPAPCSGGSVPLGRLRPEARGRRNRVASPDVGGPG